MINFDLQLDRNPEWANLPSPKKGDIVILQDSRNLGHRFKCIVQLSDRHTITARVEAIFTLDGTSNVELGDVTVLEGKELQVEREHIWEVVES